MHQRIHQIIDACLATSADVTNQAGCFKVIHCQQVGFNYILDVDQVTRLPAVSMDDDGLSTQ
jgi:hypothetical protein